MKQLGGIVVGVLATLCVLAPLAMAGGNGVGSGGLNGFPAPTPVNGAAITPSSVTTMTVKTDFLDAGTGMVNGQLQVLGSGLISSVVISGKDVSASGGSGDVLTTSGGFQVSTNKGIYFNGVTQTALVYFDGTSFQMAIPAGSFVVTGDTTSPVRGAFRLVPQDAQPSGASVVGDMYVTTAGLLKICTVAGTPGTWVSVGAQ